jgi:hypothetical protein
MNHLTSNGTGQTDKKSRQPVFGICLGNAVDVQDIPEEERSIV